MESTYWQTEGKGHHFDTSAIKVLCFNLLNVIVASRALVEAFDERQAEEPTGEPALSDPSIALHSELADTQIRTHLLQLAMLAHL